MFTPTHRWRRRCLQLPGVSADIAAPSSARPDPALQAYNAMSGYPGSKGASGVAEKIIAVFPSHDLYIEPFVGKSAVLRRKEPVASVALDVAVLGAYWSRFEHVDFIQKCGLAFLERVFLPPTALVYCDPPYPHSTRSKTKLYAQEWSDDRHRRFLRACRRLTCHVVVSTYPNDLYLAELSGWRWFDFQAMTRGGPRIERVFCNYDFDAAAGDNDFLGADFRDRWRLKKKLRRHVAKFAALPAAERRFLLRHLLDRFAPESAMRPGSESLPGVDQRHFGRVSSATDIGAARSRLADPDAEIGAADLGG